VWPDAPDSVLDLEPDAEVVVVGRTRRRFFRAGGSTQSRTEVVAEQVVAARQAKRCRQVVVGALGRIEAELG
jgi:single-strand DNA-binding protein